MQVKDELFCRLGSASKGRTRTLDHVPSPCGLGWCWRRWPHARTRSLVMIHHPGACILLVIGSGKTGGQNISVLELLRYDLWCGLLKLSAVRVDRFSARLRLHRSI